MGHLHGRSRLSHIIVLLRSTCRCNCNVLLLLLLHDIKHPAATNALLLPPSSYPQGLSLLPRAEENPTDFLTRNVQADLSSHNQNPCRTPTSLSFYDLAFPPLSTAPHPRPRDDGRERNSIAPTGQPLDTHCRSSSLGSVDSGRG